MSDRRPAETPPAVSVNAESFADLAKRSVVASRIARTAGEPALERALLKVAAEATTAALARKRRRLP